MYFSFCSLLSPEFLFFLSSATFSLYRSCLSVGAYKKPSMGPLRGSSPSKSSPSVPTPRNSILAPIPEGLDQTLC